jgi:hypothetical protein
MAKAPEPMANTMAKTMANTMAKDVAKKSMAKTPTYRYRDPEKRRAYMRDLMRRRYHAGKG